MTARDRWAGPLLAVALASHAAVALADTRSQAREAMERGVQSMNAGNYRAALAEFEHAQSLLPDANLPIRYGAQMLEKLGRTEEAIASYERYLKVKPDVRDADEVRARIAKLRAELAPARVSVRCEPADGEVFVDDRSTPLGRTPLVDAPVSPGEHTFTFKAAGQEADTIRMRLPGGGSAELTCHFRAVSPATSTTASAPPAPTVAPVATTPPPPPETPSSLRTWGWVGGGAGAVTLLTSLVLDATWLRSTIHDQQDAADRGDPSSQSLQHRAHSIQTGLRISYVAGAVLTLAGASVVLFAPRRETTSRPPTTTRVHLDTLPGGVAIGASGSF